MLIARILGFEPATHYFGWCEIRTAIKDGARPTGAQIVPLHGLELITPGVPVGDVEPRARWCVPQRHTLRSERLGTSDLAALLLQTGPLSTPRHLAIPLVAKNRLSEVVPVSYPQVEATPTSAGSRSFAHAFTHRRSTLPQTKTKTKRLP